MLSPGDEAEQRHCFRVWHFLVNEHMIPTTVAMLHCTPVAQGIPHDGSPFALRMTAGGSGGGQESTLQQQQQQQQQPEAEHDSDSDCDGDGRPASVVREFQTSDGLLSWALPFVRAKLGPARFSLNSWNTFVAEVQDSVRNETLALEAQGRFYERCMAGHAPRHSSIWSLMCELLADESGGESRRTMVTADEVLLWFERVASFAGHPLHPGSKCKVGMTEAQVRKYAPELAEPGGVEVVLVAIQRDWLSVISSDGTQGGDWFKSDGLLLPHVVHLWTNWLSRTGRKPERFWPVPVHPVHIQHLRSRFGGLLSRGLLVIDGAPSFPSTPTLAFRTVVPSIDLSSTATTSATATVASTATSIAASASRDSLMHLKLSVNVQATSLKRYVSPVEAHDSPLLTTMLRRMLDLSDHFGHSLFIMDEPVGVYLNYHKQFIDEHGADANTTGRVPAYTYDDARYLSCLWRAGAQRLVDQFRNTPATNLVKTAIHSGTRRVATLPLAALFCTDPLDGSLGETAPGSLLVTLMRVVAGVRSSSAAQSYFENYCRVVLRGQLGIWLECGIVLEAHQQNCVLCIDLSTGELLATAHRDLCGGLCGNRNIIESLDRSPLCVEDESATAFRFADVTKSLHPRQDYLFDGFDEYDYMLGAFEHTVIRSHLVPLARVVAHEFGLDHLELVGGVVRGIVEELVEAARSEVRDGHVGADEPELWQRHVRETERYLLERDRTQFKCLMSMRCMSTKEEFYVEATNPLYRAAE